MPVSLTIRQAGYQEADICTDMDLVVLIDDPNAALEPSHFVQMIGDLLERETNFVVSRRPCGNMTC